MNTLQDEDKIKIVGEHFQKISEVSKSYIHYWYHHTFLHWDFFVAWLLAAVPWSLWLVLRKKDSTGRFLLAGFFALIFSSWLDFIGVELGLWYYTGLAIPTIPSYVPWDFCLFPVMVMFLLQWKPNASRYLKALLFASFCSFVAEPIFRWIGFYVMVQWHYAWSMPIYFVMYLLCDKFSRIQSFRDFSEATPHGSPKGSRP